MKPYYEEDGITIYLGDCRDVLPHLPKVDLVLTDPPYGIGFEYYSYDDTRENLRDLISSLFAQGFEKLAILCGPSQIHEYPPCDWVGAICWNTTGSFGAFGYSQWTPLLLYGVDQKGFGSVNGVLKSDVLNINGGGSVGFQRSASEKKHTCPKPFNIMRYCVARHSRVTDTILDPFMGSGTTLLAAKQLGRKAIGIELEEKYCEIAVQRLRQGVLAL